MNKRHYEISLETLAIALGLKGEPIHAWSDQNPAWLHIMTADPDAPTLISGSYVESELITVSTTTVTAKTVTIEGVQ